MLLWAEDATVVLPMELVTVPFLPGMPQMARSYDLEAGTVTFEFELACPAVVSVMGLIWDYEAGVEPQNADSYYASINGGPEVTWAYGCDTLGGANEVWTWQPVSTWTLVDCNTVPFDANLAAGPHEVTLRNREAGGGINAAAVLAIVVTDDPSFDPYTLYDPGP